MYPHLMNVLSLQKYLKAEPLATM